MNIEIVNYKMKSWIKTGFVVILTLIVLLVCYLLILSEFKIKKLLNINDTIPIVVVIGGLLFILFIFYTLNLRVIQKVGTITIQNDKFILNKISETIEFPYHDLQHVRIKIMGYCGQQLTGGRPPVAGFAGETTSDGYHQLQGYENRIRFKTKYGNKYSYNFYLGTKTDSDNIKAFLKKQVTVVNMKLTIVR